MSETLDQFAERVVMKLRRELMDQLDDDVIAEVGKSHIIFAKACVAEAIGTAMREAKAASSPIAAGEGEK